MSTVVHRSSVGVTAVLTMDSPANRNALSGQLVEELADGLESAAAEQSVRAIVITGAGSTFCSGADLTNPPVADGPGSFASVLSRLWSYPKPVVVAVNGHVRAGGFGLVAAGDVVLCADSATFALTEVRIGVVPAIISVLLTRRMRPLSASRYMLTGEKFDAETACAAGLVSEVVPAEELSAAVERLAKELSQCEPNALEVTRQLIRELEGVEVEDGLARARVVSERMFGSPAAKEGIAAFREKRPPSWAVEVSGS